MTDITITFKVKSELKGNDLHNAIDHAIELGLDIIWKEGNITGYNDKKITVDEPYKNTLTIKCMNCDKTYLIKEIRWSDGEIFTCYDCQHERFKIMR